MNKRKLRKLFMYANAEFFNNELPEIPLYTFTGNFGFSDSVGGVCSYDDETGKNLAIYVHRKRKGQTAIKILLHEMIHAWEILNGFVYWSTDYDEMHGPTFMMWAEYIAKKLDINPIDLLWL